MSDVTGEVRRIIADQMGDQLEGSSKDIQDDASFVEDLGLDSVDILELFAALEEHYKIEISDEDKDKIKTVGDVIKHIESCARN